MPKKKFKSAEIIGKNLAVLQHGFDKLFEWGFKKIKETSSETKKVKDESTFVSCLKKIGGFFGVMGEEYYRKYEDLKKKKRK